MLIYRTKISSICLAVIILLMAILLPIQSFAALGEIKCSAVVLTDEAETRRYCGNYEICVYVKKIMDDPDNVLRIGMVFPVYYDSQNQFKRGDIIEVYGKSWLAGQGPLQCICSVIASYHITKIGSEATGEKELRYDDGSIDISVAPYSEEPGSEIAVKFTPRTYPMTLKKVSFYIAGYQQSLPSTQFEVRIYTDDNGFPGYRLDRGNIIGSALTGAEWVEIDVSQHNIVINRKRHGVCDYGMDAFYVSMYWKTAPGLDGTNAQFLGLDKNPPIDNRTYWKWGESGSWRMLESGHSGYGDAMIRAVFDTYPPLTSDVIEFCGYKWDVKHSDQSIGPGPNLWSNRIHDVWVNDDGLHLWITEREGKYYCTEVSTQKSFGYGTYIFYLDADMDDNVPDSNIVLGLFTYDENTCETNANTEIDIEFSKWGNQSADILNYSVQPTDVYGEPSIECSKRHRASRFVLNEGTYTTHVFTWKPNSITFESYHGHGYPTPYPIVEDGWIYDITDPNCAFSKTKNAPLCDSKLIGIPKVTKDTKVRINFWLNEGKEPQEEREVIIKKFVYIPLSIGSISLLLLSGDGL